MPGPGHNHSAKMERCLEDLKAKGHDPGSAHAICYTSLGSDANKIEKGGGTEECPICIEIHKAMNPARMESIIAKDEKRRYTLGIVYEPDALDTDNEFAKAEDIEEAAHDFMREIQGRRGLAKVGLDIVAKIQEAMATDAEIQLEVTDALDEIAKRGVNAMHQQDLEDCEIVESYIAPADMVVEGQAIKKGTWLAGIIWSPEHFAKIESGKWTGYSMGGTARKQDA